MFFPTNAVHPHAQDDSLVPLHITPERSRSGRKGRNRKEEHKIITRMIKEKKDTGSL
jgi:hypothetical protein